MSKDSISELMNEIDTIMTKTEDEPNVYVA